MRYYGPIQKQKILSYGSIGVFKVRAWRIYVAINLELELCTSSKLLSVPYQVFLFVSWPYTFPTGMGRQMGMQCIVISFPYCGHLKIPN